MKSTRQTALNLATPIAPIETWDDADQVGKEFALLDFDIASAEGEMNRLITAIQEQMLPKIKAMKAEHGAKEKRLLSFAKAHRQDFGGKKSRKLNFITLSFKKVSERVELTEEEAIVIANLKRAGLDRGVVKTKESVDKKALLLTVPEKKRDQIGFNVIPTGDTPEVKVDRKIVESFKRGEGTLAKTGS